MKTNRKFEFVLTVVENGVTVENLGQTGEFMFKSDCHYYCEKEIVSNIKLAERNGTLNQYYDYKYLIYKRIKSTTEIIETKDGNKTIIEKIQHSNEDTAVLIETITVDENGINIE